MTKDQNDGAIPAQASGAQKPAAETSGIPKIDTSVMVSNSQDSAVRPVPKVSTNVILTEGVTKKE